MPTASRTMILVCLLGTSSVAQVALDYHLQRAGILPVVPLAAPLEQFPAQLGEWRGEDVPVTDASFLYGDDHLNRAYFRPGYSQPVWLWIGYSKDGADRGNNPEVCMPSHGFFEQQKFRGSVVIDDGAKPRRYRFARADGSESQWVYYWHYTLVPPIALDALTPFQVRELLHQPISSLTIEVFAPGSATSPEVVEEFVRSADGALQKHLSPSAIRGSKLLPV